MRMACNSPDCGECYDCQSNCDTCQGGCQSCQTCNSCQICDKCMSSCDAGGQASYNEKTISSIFGEFSFSLTPVKDQVQMGPLQGMFNKAIWDELAAWISQRNKLPTGYDGEAEGYTVEHANPDGGPKVDSSTESAVRPFSADEFNRIATIVGASRVSSGDLIEASLFSNLVSAANEKAVNDGACKYCVTVCDLTYDKCKTCNESQCSSYCQSCNATCNGCDSCDDGECCDGCEGSCETCNSCNNGETEPTPTPTPT